MRNDAGWIMQDDNATVSPAVHQWDRFFHEVRYTIPFKVTSHITLHIEGARGSTASSARHLFASDGARWRGVRRMESPPFAAQTERRVASRRLLAVYSRELKQHVDKNLYCSARGDGACYKDEYVPPSA